MGKALDVIIPIAAAAAGTLIGGPIGGAAGAGLGSAGVNYSQTHNIGNALTAGGLSAGGSYIGGNVANNLLGGQLGTVGSTLGINPIDGTTGASSNIASFLGSGGTQAFNSAVGSPISQLAGSYLGGSLGSSLAPQGPGSNAGNYPFVPSQAGAATAPTSLNSMSSLTPMQQASGLATQGVYGGGLGPQEQSYYGNLLNRQLIDSSGNVSPLSSLSPIEQTYNQNLGFGNQANSNSLLQALSQWNPS